jgi:hypothetical protein
MAALAPASVVPWSCHESINRRVDGSGRLLKGCSVACILDRLDARLRIRQDQPLRSGEDDDVPVVKAGEAISVNRRSRARPRDALKT